MDRAKLIQAILNVYRTNVVASETYFVAGLSRIPDADLVTLANNMGVDTDSLFAVPS